MLTFALGAIFALAAIPLLMAARIGKNED